MSRPDLAMLALAEALGLSRDGLVAFDLHAAVREVPTLTAEYLVVNPAVGLDSIVREFDIVARQREVEAS